MLDKREDCNIHLVTENGYLEGNALSQLVAQTREKIPLSRHFLRSKDVDMICKAKAVAYTGDGEQSVHYGER